jgi:hypothetical protein
MLLPRKATLVSVTENLGRTLLLVEFADGQHEYLFEHEVKFENGNALREEYEAGANAHIWKYVLQWRKHLTEVVMAIRNKIYFIICGIVAQLLLFGDVRAAEIQPKDNGSEQELVSGPQQHQMTLVSLEPWVVEGELLGLVAAYTYDDVSTERPADYWELYNNQGSLVAVSWFDKFGARRTAVDRGIVEEADHLEGVFVIVSDGTSIWQKYSDALWRGRHPDQLAPVSAISGWKLEPPAIKAINEIVRESVSDAVGPELFAWICFGFRYSDFGFVR